MKLQFGSIAGLLVAALLCSPTGAFAGPILGKTGQSFAVLGASTVTSTGVTFIDGRLGVSPGTAITGSPTVSRQTFLAGPVAAQGQADAGQAYNMLSGLPCDTNLTNKILGTSVGAVTLAPGVYCFNVAAELTGTLTLDSGGDPDGIWIFQIASTLTTSDNSEVLMAANSSAGNVFWTIGTSATIGSNTAMVGNVIALESVTVVSGATVEGSVYARVGAVTMDTNTIGRTQLVASNAAITAVGTGAISVPNPDDLDPRADGTGRANFQFNVSRAVDGGAVTGHLFYENLVKGLIIRGPVDDITVLTWHGDGRPKIVAFSGVCNRTVPDCKWVVTVEEDAAPRARDKFGITVNGLSEEVRTPRTARCSPRWTACRINVTP